jgi:hypothetical protein
LLLYCRTDNLHEFIAAFTLGVLKGRSEARFHCWIGSMLKQYIHDVSLVTRDRIS